MHDGFCCTLGRLAAPLPFRLPRPACQPYSILTYLQTHSFRVRYVLGPVLGAGSFGVVRECTDRRSGRRFAVKSINKVGGRVDWYLIQSAQTVIILAATKGSCRAVRAGAGASASPIHEHTRACCCCCAVDLLID